MLNRALSARTSARVVSGRMVIGIDDHAAFELLHLAHLVGLVLGIEVAVDDAEAAGLGHGDGQPALGDRVHGGGDDRDGELMARVRRVRVSKPRPASTGDAPGFSRTSSKVRYSGKSTTSGLAIAPSLAPAAKERRQRTS